MSLDNLLEVRAAKTGKGVFTREPLRKGAIIFDLKGRILDEAQLPNPYVDDHYCQIGRRTYLGPSGGTRDFVNHSCEPNAWIRIDRTMEMIALRDIWENEEITFDYSTTMHETDWEMDCKCGAEDCRRKIKEFRKLPKAVREKYIALGVVPSYNR